MSPLPVRRHGARTSTWNSQLYTYATTIKVPLKDKILNPRSLNNTFVGETYVVEKMEGCSTAGERQDEALLRIRKDSSLEGTYNTDGNCDDANHLDIL